MHHPNRVTPMKWFQRHSVRLPFVHLAPIERQVRKWRRANRRMRWRIPASAFRDLPAPPALTAADREDGFIGVLLAYGFGRSDAGGSDAVLSGALAWALARRRWKLKTSQCRYIDFAKPDRIRLRTGAPQRPQGFYFAKFKPGDAHRDGTVSRFLQALPAGDTGCGPEGIQLLTVTHPHLAVLMNRGRIPFMAFADYDVAPHGFHDFYDAVQMFCSVDTLGLGIGNVDQNYPLFGIPTLRF